MTPTPVQIAQRLIQFDTTNPPGNERACVAYIDQMLSEAGIETTLIGKHDERPNLIARLKGYGDRPPLLLYGHVDVVQANPDDWTHPPFEGVIDEEYLWGRGALDMKGAVAMMISAVLRVHREGNLPGDVILVVLADEEAYGGYGAKFLVEEHPEQFDGVQYALSEFGGFTFYVGDKRFYPIMVGEKQLCQMMAILRGPAGHGALLHSGGTMARLAQLISRLDQNRLPVHITPPVRDMLTQISDVLSFPQSFVLRQLLNPAMTDFMLDQLGERSSAFSPMLHNTANPTMLSASQTINVIPDRVEVGIDGRLLPGFTAEDFIAEIRQVTGVEAEFEMLTYEPGPPEADMTHFETLAAILRRADPEGIPIPYLLTASSDARLFARLGIQTYGFTPMQLPPDFNFTATVHGVDERIPVESLDFGTHMIVQAIQEL